MNNRRAACRAILAAAAGALTLPLPQSIFAQPDRKTRRLGMLFKDATPPPGANLTLARLAELGWTENQTLHVERVFANDSPERFPELARQLVRNGADVITADAIEAVLAASRATSSTPIVLAGLAAPVERGLIESYARPGHNITGVSSSASGVDLASKRLTLLKEIVPKARRLAWLTPIAAVQDASGKVDYSRSELNARKAGFEPVIYPISSQADLEKIFKEILARRTEVLSIGESAFLRAHMEQIIGFANGHRLPTGCASELFVDGGGLLTYAVDLVQMARSIGDCIDRMLRGENPATTPIEFPTKFVTVLNVKTAKLLHLTIPQSVLVRVDRLIQ